MSHHHHEHHVTTAYPHPMQPEMYQEQRQRIAKTFSSSKEAALLQGGSEVPINSSDTTYLFRQESYFEYLFGYSVPDCFGAVLSDGTGILFIPRLPASYAVWMGELPTPAAVQEVTKVDAVHYVDEIESVLKTKGVETIHVLHGVNSDSGLTVLTAHFEGMDKTFHVNKSFLFNALATQRTIKTSLEAEVLKYVCSVSSKAHIHVMQHCKPGMSQHQLESMFLHHVYFHGGCRRVSYTCICATGHHGAVLHYPNNDALIEDGSMALLDMGGEYRCYASDITTSYPVNGCFTADQRMVYEAVLDAHNNVLRTMKAGASWVDMHRLALRIMCTHLVQHGVLHGTVDELMDAQIMKLFQPHGMGHLIGLDVHDVGGYLDGQPQRPEAADCCKLRFAHTLKPGYYVTVEPGCYFNHVLLTQALNDPALKPFLNEDVIRSRFWNFGGVRIESDVLVTDTGAINFTIVPRTVDEIEATMRGEPFSGTITEYKNVA